MNASKSINIKIAIILTAKINRIMLKEIFAHNSCEVFCRKHKLSNGVEMIPTKQ